MQIVIDMPDTYITENIIRTAEWEEGSLFDQVLRCALKKAIILPKGHGKLKDVSKFHYVTMLSQNSKTGKHKHITVVRAQEINKAPTIIEADKEK